MGNRKLVYGVGVNDWHTSISQGSSKHIPEYKMWLRVLERSLSERWKEANPTYKDVTVDPRWYSMKAFIEDVSTLTGFDKALTESWHLDKDLLVKGNKLYSKGTCCFLPIEINSLLTSCKASRGELPIGVRYVPRYSKRPYVPAVRVDGKQKSLGNFSTPEEAFYAYKEAKEAYVKRIANLWKGEIDARVYDVLMAWEVNIDD